MKQHRVVYKFWVILFILFVSACGSQGTQTTGKNGSTATVSVGLKRSLAAISGDSGNLASLASITLTVTAPDMATIAASLPLNGDTLSIDVPAGVNRVFTAAAWDTGGTMTHAGSTTVAQLVAGERRSVSITLDPLIPDTTPPGVTSTSPADGATDIATNTVIVIVFSEAMNAATLTAGTTFTLSDGTNAVAGSVSYDAATRTATFTPSSNLSTITTYTATVTTGARDLAGNGLAADRVWTFTTAALAPADTTPPGVTSTSPADGATDIATNTVIVIVFSEAMNAATLTAGTTFTLSDGTNAVAGSVSYDAATRTATFTPSSNLSTITTYTATVTTGARDLAGNGLAADRVWTFTIAALAPADTTPPTVTSTSPADGTTNVEISTTLDFTASTHASEWLVYGAGVSGVPAVRFDATPHISFSDNAHDSGTFIPGASAADFTGVWMAVYSFDLPQSARDIVMDFSGLGADDRTVLQANTRDISNAVVDGSSGPGQFSFDLANTTPAIPYSFSGASGTSGTIVNSELDGPFEAGATNSLTLWVNNSPSDPLSGDAVPLQSFFDGTSVGVDGTITYSDFTVTVTFSEAMDCTSLSDSTFTLNGGAGAVAGSVACSGATATFTPESSLSAGTVYTATVTTGTRDLAGNSLAADYVFSFSTGGAPSGDVVPPAFAGFGVAVPSSPTSVDIAWSAATDNVSASEQIVYDISLSATPGETFSVSYTSDPGAASFTISGLSEGTHYFIVVRARDQAGNRDGNILEAQVKTPVAGPDPNGIPPIVYDLKGTPTAGVPGGVSFSYNDINCSDLTFLLFMAIDLYSCPGSGGPVSVDHVYLYNGNYTVSLWDGALMVQEMVLSVSNVSDWNPPGPSRLAAGGTQTLAIRADGTAVSWGTNNGGALGTGIPVGGAGYTPAAVQDLTDLISVDARAWYSIALKDDGTVWGWGWGPNIGLGAINNPDPVQIIDLVINQIIAISAGYSHGLALSWDGAVYGFGSEDNNVIGMPIGSNAARPLDGLSGIIAVAAGAQHSMALKANGTVLAWGNNTYGQLGDGSYDPHDTPTAVSGLSNVVAIAAGSFHSVALKSDGTVWAWGRNDHGQVGDGSFVEQPLPVQVLSGVTSISTGEHHTLALMNDGTVQAWGDNAYGVIGDGTRIDQGAPVPVAGLGSGEWVVEVEGGEFHSAARLADGTVWTWGTNALGQLGDGTQTDQLVPIQVPGLNVDASSWTRQMGSATHEIVSGVAVDGNGNVHVAGSTVGDLDGNLNAGGLAPWDLFVVKYDASGVKQWTRQLGTTAEEHATGVAVDESGDVYVSGYTEGSLDGNTNAGSLDLFVVKYDASGVKQWTQQIGTTSFDIASGVSVDTSGDVYVAGYTSGGLDGNTNVGNYSDLFVVKYDASGVKQWTRQLGGSGSDQAFGIDVDGSGNVYAAGWTYNNLDGNTSAGDRDLFVVKYDASGVKQWTRQLGTDVIDDAFGVSVDESGNSYVVGRTAGSLDGNTNAGDWDLFMVKYDASGVKQWTRQLGSPTSDLAYGVAVDGCGNVYVAGYTAGSLDGNTSAGDWDLFMVKYDASGVKQWTQQFGSPTTDYATGVAVDGCGMAYVAGSTLGSLDGIANAGTWDLFVVKYNASGVKQ
jgi:alpha-tubulin suppressor-like RCC1 family protein